jgi:hypothetical protein
VERLVLVELIDLPGLPASATNPTHSIMPAIAISPPTSGRRFFINFISVKLNSSP